MCLAVPARIKCLIGDRLAEAEYQGNQLTVDIGLVDARPGDYVLIHAGCAIEKIDAVTAAELSGLLRDLSLC
jgi:hydrogenase expression/formation protein HypC